MKKLYSFLMLIAFNFSAVAYAGSTVALVVPNAGTIAPKGVIKIKLSGEGSPLMADMNYDVTCHISGSEPNIVLKVTVSGYLGENLMMTTAQINGRTVYWKNNPIKLDKIAGNTLIFDHLKKAPDKEMVMEMQNLDSTATVIVNDCSANFTVS